MSSSSKEIYESTDRYKIEDQVQYDNSELNSKPKNG